MNVAGKRDVLLPEDNPVAGEDQQKKHEFWIAENGQEILQRFRNAGWRSIADFFRFAEENQDGEEHQEDAESSHAKNIFDAEMAVRPRSDVRAGGAADVHHGVVDGVADGADVFF